jgi:hypothetical protein
MQKARGVCSGLCRVLTSYFDELREDRFSPPWLLRWLDPLAWLREDFESLFAEPRSDLLRELLLELLDCFVAMLELLLMVPPLGSPL